MNVAAMIMQDNLLSPKTIFSFQKELYEQEGQLRFPVTRPRKAPLLIFEILTKELGGLDRRTYPEFHEDKDLVK